MIFWMFLDSLRFWFSRSWKYLLLGLFIALVLVSGFIFRGKISALFPGKETISGTTNVAIPTIVNGELVLPKVATGAAVNVLGKQAKLGIVSANLIGVQDQQTQQLVAIRVLGEVSNIGERIVDGVSPVVRFIDKDGKTIGQKIGRLSSGWEFFGVKPSEKTLYDVTVDSPPSADKLEIVLNASSSTDSAVFDQLKIASRSVEVKQATYQGTGGGGQGTGSGVSAEKVEYYSVTGSVVNILSDPVSDITIYSWARDKEGKVFAFNRQDFKNDLLTVGDKVDFRILLLPLKMGEDYDSYEVAAWGKRYKLNL